MRGHAALAGLALALVTCPAPAAAVLLTLDEADRQEALRTGERSVTSESFGHEWRIVQGSGESVTVLTPFHRLALAARHAAFKKEPLKPQDQTRALDEVKDRLVFWVDLHGRREDFARHLRPRLVAGPREIEPSLVQNDRTALRRENGSYLARCQYAFPTKDLSPSARLTLVVRDPDGRVVAQFPLDLSRMR